MTARILVVDDVPANLRLLETRLAAEYYEITTASSGPEALTACSRDACDLVLLDVMMPGMDGFETCRRLKADPLTAHVPVVLLTALDQPSDRVRGLDSGADDFLTKPYDELSLLARVKSLTRLKVMTDELRGRVLSTASIGIAHCLPAATEDKGLGGRILLVEDRASAAERAVATLHDLHDLVVLDDPGQMLLRAAEGDYDLFIISLGLKDFDGLRLCSQLRSLERTRSVPILILAEADDRARVLRGFDLGVNDLLTRPIDPNELVARVRTQVRRKRYADRLRQTLQTSLEAAVVDSLTGLNNRRYLETALGALVRTAVGRDRPLCAMLLDLDHFKAVNDTYGHDVGDEVLKIFALRLRQVVRSGDIVCRLGGEEFIVVLPETRLDVAQRVAERIRSTVGLTPFAVADGTRQIDVTVSIGLADRGRDGDSAALMKRADQALYRSKHGGRNRVSAQAA